MSVPSSEALQTQLLNTLDSSSSGSIPDTRQLEHNGVKLASSEDQGAVKSVLDSLASKEVSQVQILRQSMRGGGGWKSACELQLTRERRWLSIHKSLRLPKSSPMKEAP